MAFWWIVLCWFFVPSAVMGVTGDEIIAEVQERLTDYKTFSARFEKKFYWAVLDKQRNREGRIYLSRPDRFRIELQGGDVIVSDGEAIWSYIERNGQVVVGPYEGEVKTPWEMFFDYSERYTPIAVEENELAGGPVICWSWRPRTRYRWSKGCGTGLIARNGSCCRWSSSRPMGT